MYDVLVIGGGVIGCSILRELSKYQLNIALVERCSDLCEGTSKANSGIVHAGYDAMPGTLKAKLNVRGSELMEELSKELNFGYKRCGSLVLCFDETDIPKLEELKKRGEANGVKGLRILNKNELKVVEPNLNTSVVAALDVPDGAIVDPFNLTYAMADNAVINGASISLNTEVIDIRRLTDGYEIICKKHSSVLDRVEREVKLEARMIVNAAGVYADSIHNLVSSDRIEIKPRKGEYMLLDNTAGDFVGHTIFQLPTALGKGILITPTVHGNLLTGPTADDIEAKEGTDTTLDGLNLVKAKAKLSAENIPLREVITSFAGLRARLTQTVKVRNHELSQMEHDFLIGEVLDAPGFFDVAGIESPGLSSAPAIAEYVVELIKDIDELLPKQDFKAQRVLPKPFVQADDDERKELIDSDALYGNMVCRCCWVTEAEIVNAIHAPVPATTLDAIKRRTGAQMGRCQSGFCNPKIVEILSRELKVDSSCVTKNDSGSEVLVG